MLNVIVILKMIIWNDFSCAYDSLLTILLAVYTESEQAWNMNIPENNRVLEYIGGIFRQATGFSPVLTLSEAKDKVRQHLGREDLSLGFLGSEGIDIYHLRKKVFTSDTNIVDKQYIFHSCRYEGEVSSLNISIWILDKFIW